jgi:hypothetical protein
MKARIAVLPFFLAVCCMCSILVLAGCKAGSPSDNLQSRLNQFCSEQALEDGTMVDNLTRSDAFFSPKTTTCVKVEVTGGKDWSYELRDLTHNFMRGPKWIEYDQPLTVYHREYRTFKSAHAEGFWKATSSDKGKQLVDRIAVKIDCESDEGVCREHQAAILMNVVQPDSVEYKISRWDDFGIIADTEDDLNECETSHRLAISFPTNSVTVTDYAKKSTGNCKQTARDASSYSLHGGNIMLYGQYGIFTCDQSGVDNVVVEKVEKLHGDVGQKKYDEYMDDGAGGQPRAIKTPAKPYTPEQCQRAMDVKIAELKAY